MILVDCIRRYHAPHLRTDEWAHMVSDTSEEELHAFAARLGHHSAFWHKNHYDLTPKGLAEALRLGAVQVSTRELARRRCGSVSRRRRPIDGGKLYDGRG